jgi:hypothetical protein
MSTVVELPQSGGEWLWYGYHKITLFHGVIRSMVYDNCHVES